MLVEMYQITVEAEIAAKETSTKYWVKSVNLRFKFIIFKIMYY